MLHPKETIKTDEDLLHNVRELVEWVSSTFEYPHSWPLTDDNRVTFIRGAYWRVKLIRESEPYLRGRLIDALKQYEALDNPQLMTAKKAEKMHRDSLQKK